MALGSAQVSVGTTATLLSTTTSDDVAGSRIAVSADTLLFVGPAGVTTANGFRVAAGATFSDDLQPGEALYGIVASGTVTAYVYRGGV